MERGEQLKRQFEDKNHAAAFDRYIDVMAKLIMKYGVKVLAHIRENRHFAAPPSFKWLRRKGTRARLEHYWKKLNKIENEE